MFDRERRSVYNFLIVATDSGKYNARSQNVSVQVNIADVNDNKPIFSQYPFKANVSAYIQPGQSILKVTAKDADEGINAEMVYSLINEDTHRKFRLNPNTGILTTSQSLASENGKNIHLKVMATDKGNPPKSSIGLIEISVGDIPIGFPQLAFQNSTYHITIAENSEKYKEVIQVTAVKTDGRKQNIIYSIGSGNEEGIFSINSRNGLVQVDKSDLLDYETYHEIRLVVEAKTDTTPPIYGYAQIIVHLTDENDNSPKFTQQQYTATVWEGNNKGTFVLQVIASDSDERQNAKVLYHIVDGNHDNAFKIEPAFSGILKTNIVLDREIRDTYRLTVIATDEGVPQMTGTARIRINIVDVNDNQPTFPPHNIITVSEGKYIFSLLSS